ncbi:conserved exported hypothetical protein [uncultured Eubacteriales bacterium]|uniref:Uncharacterized protein n=1 Tax=uncultured Eubacteriales bacterium TaxID=172733 RepID=A0A212KLP0_9FIRM|nr:conserved exported hypothetical protein [uncultured Eubacteriales bacterium]
MFRRLTAALLTVALLCCVPAAAAAGSRYSDVPPDDWSVTSIEKATEYGLMEGISASTFGYGYQMNRASFVTVLCRMFGWTQVTAAPSYTDTASHWASGWIEAALQHGAVESGGAFRPDDSITREEMAVMLVRALDYDQLASSMASNALPFTDIATGASNRGYIALAFRFGIINGVKQDDGTYRFFPDQPSNRETAAAMLVRVYERYTSKIDWLHAFYAFGSYSQISLTAQMDAVSVGWARLDVDPLSGPYLNQTTTGGNEWNIPSGASLATDAFKANGIPYNLSVFSSTSDALTLSDGTVTSDLAAILASEAARTQAVAAIVAAVGPYNGVTIDFEGLREDKREAFTAFMTALRAALPADKALWAAVQPPDWYKGYDYRALGELCDKVILMAHDYKDRSTPVVGSSSTDNPVTPFPQVAEALAAITDPDTGVRDKSKIALAIAIDSAGYQIDSNGKIAAATLYSPGVDTLTNRLRQADAVRGWSDVYRNPYLTYTGDDGSTYRVWYEDAQSVMEKIQLAAMFGVTGVSLWRLGNIPTVSDPGLDYDVWSSLLTHR